MNDAHPDKFTLFIRRAAFPFILTLAVVATLFVNMPASDPATDTLKTGSKPGTTNVARSDANVNGQIQAPKSPGAVAPAGPPKLSGAEIKAQKKAEKAARRQQETQAKQVGSTTSAPKAGGKTEGQHAPAQRGKGESGSGQHKRTGSMVTDQKNIPLRAAHPSSNVPQEPAKEDKTVELFRHLYKMRATTIAGAGKEVHPAVLALGQQMSSYTICGSNARLVATLQAFKLVSSFISFFDV